MKLNFWQWLGLAALVIGLIGYVAFQGNESDAPAPGETVVTPPPATTQPVAAP